MAAAARIQRTLPTILRGRWVWWVGIAAIIIPFFVKIPLFMRRHPVISALGDQLHVAFLALVTMLLFWRGPVRGHLWLAALAAAVAGASIEFLQPLFGRAALFHDFLLDLVGIGIVVGFVLWRRHRSRLGLALMTVLLISVPAQLYYVPGVVAASKLMHRTFPLITDFESGRDHWITSANYETHLAFVHVSDGIRGPSDVLRVTGGPPAHWPGVKMRRFPHDWSGYSSLEFDVRVASASGDSVPMAIRLDDYESTRANLGARLGFVAGRDWRTIRFNLAEAPLGDGSRSLDLNDVDLILVYLPRPQAPVTFDIDNIRLIP